MRGIIAPHWLPSLPSDLSKRDEFLPMKLVYLHFRSGFLPLWYHIFSTSLGATVSTSIAHGRAALHLRDLPRCLTCRGGPTSTTTWKNCTALCHHRLAISPCGSDPSDAVTFNGAWAELHLPSHPSLPQIWIHGGWNGLR